MSMFSPVDTTAAAQAADTNRKKYESLTSAMFAKSKAQKLGRPTRLLPPAMGMKLPWIDVYKHEIRDPHDKQAQMETSWVCPRHHGGGRCLLCEMADALGGADKDLEKMLRPRVRYLAFDVRIEDGSPILRKFEFGATVKSALLSLINDRGLDYSSMAKGFSIDIAYDKSKAPALMWTAERPDDCTAIPFDKGMEDKIAAEYPSQGLGSVLFIPDPTWQYKQFISGKASRVELPWNIVSNLPVIEGEDSSARSESSSYTRRPDTATSKSDFSVAVGEDDIPF